MSDYLGDFSTGSTLRHSLTMLANGAPTDIVGGALAVYVDSSTTQLTAGLTFTPSFDGVVGLHHIVVVFATAGLVAGQEASVVLTAGTLSGQSLAGLVLCTFSVERVNGVLALLKSRLVGTIASGTHQPQSGDAYARVGVNGTGLTAVPWNSSWDVEVQSEAEDALIAHHLDHLIGNGTAVPAVTAGTYLDQLMDDGTAVYDRTTDSLQAQRDQAALIKAKTDNLPAAPAAVGSAMTLTSGERDAMAAALLDLANGVETGKTVRKALQAMAAILAGDVTGAGTATELFRALGNPGTTRVTVPVDNDGNRTGVTVS